MMIPRQERSRIGPILLTLVAFSLTGIVGCQDIDWNWDMDWWKKPKRVVRPTRATKNRSVSPQKQPQTQAQQPAEKKQDSPQKSPQESPQESRPAPKSDPVSQQTKAPSPANPPQQAKPSTPTPAKTEKYQDRPYYQLYFISDGNTGEEDRGTESITLNRANARLCASLVEMLYIPLGRSGSHSECYLLFEEIDEFRAVMAIAPTFDRTPLETAPKTIGAKAAFQAGIGMFLGIIKQGVAVEPSSVASCERLFVEALQSNQLTAGERWSAGILAGRVVSEYRYDYATAASYYRQALQHAAPGSLEEMSGRWWRADAFTQQGLEKEAGSEYRTIVRTFEDKWPHSHIVNRARSILRKAKK